MVEGIVVSVVVAYAAAWFFLKSLRKWEEREAGKIRARMNRKMLIRHGRILSDREIVDNGKSDILHGWD